MATIEKARTSFDPEEITKGRAAVKRKFSIAITSLTKIVEKIDDPDIDKDTVSRSVVSKFNDIKEHYELLGEIHDRLIEARDEKTDKTEEEAQMKKDSEYILEIEESFMNASSLVEKFEVTKKKQMMKLSIPERKKQHTEAKQSLIATKSLATKVSISSDPLEQRTAELIKNKLTKEINNLKEMKSSLVKAMEEEDAEDKVSVDDVLEEDKDVSELIHSLDKIILKLADDKPVPVESRVTDYIKLKKIDCPKFSGVVREFATFKKEFMSIVAVSGRPKSEIGINLKNAIPKKHQHLIDNIDTDNYEEMMTVLTAKFGQTHLIIDSVVVEIEKIKIVTNDKQYLEFVESLEKIRRDLEALNLFEEIANSTVIGKLEQKLPTLVRRDWTKKVVDEKIGEKKSMDKFKDLMKFLVDTKKQVEYDSNESRHGGGGVSRSQVATNFVTGITANNAKPPNDDTEKVKDKPKKMRFFPCLACNEDGATDPAVTQHSMGSCAVWNSLSLKDKERKVKCKRCPFSTNHTTNTCSVKNRICRICSSDSHHILLCPKQKASSNLCSTKSMIGNTTSLLPVMVQTGYVTGEFGDKHGAMFDLCSTDDYVTHDCAIRHGFPGVDVELIVEGIAGTEVKIDTKLYTVILVDNTGVRHELPCYGLEKISSIAAPPEKKQYRTLCAKFGVKPEDVKRPKKIDILISMRQNHLHPTPLKTVGDMKLYKGVFGLVFGGSDPELEISPSQLFQPASTIVSLSSPIQKHQNHTMRAVVRQATYTNSAKADRDFLDYFKEENIGTECNPRCGGCLCGKCPLGSKQMSLRDERKYERFKSCMEYDKTGTETDPGPYWRIAYPWDINKHSLPNNKPAVMGVMKSTVRKLKKDENWLKIYEEQLNTLVEKGFAREISEEEIKTWQASGGKTYYIAHQMVVNSASKSTPVRVVFNSSQVYKGGSLNSSWDLGPDVMSNLHGILLRFREDRVAAQGDIAKMYYMLRITREEEMMQLFLWRFSGEEHVRTFCMTRLVMGNKPSANFSIIGVKETAKLRDFPDKYPIGHRALTDDSYVDNVFLTASDHTLLLKGIEETEIIAKEGGFLFKEWITSGQNIPEHIVGVKLSDETEFDEERALGVGWDVFHDQFFIITESEDNLTRRPPKSGEVIDHLGPEYPIQPVLTLRICLSKHARAFDPHGLVLPTKMVGNLLFRKTLQHMKQELKEKVNKIPWDVSIPLTFRDQWLRYFTMLAVLKEIKFRRSIKPDNVKSDSKPILVTFNDGNPDSYGVVAYGLWELDDGRREARLIMSKAKLGPMTHQGETVKNELSGATYASRLKVWIMEHSRLEFQRHIPFLDSQIVQAMILKDSYGYNTFAALRVAEIQQKTDPAGWLHIPGDQNISDILTRGASPEKLGQDSVWQRGPHWLIEDPLKWPVTTRQTTLETREAISSFEKKSVVSTSAQTLLSGTSLLPKTLKVAMTDSRLDELLLRCGELTKLIRSTAYVMRMMGRTPRQRLWRKQNNLELRHSSGEITTTEYNDAWTFLIYWEQKQRLIQKNCVKLVPKMIERKLSSYNLSYPHVILGGRIRNFPESFSGNLEIPIVPYGVLARLIVIFYHNKYHTEVDTIVTYVRRDVWIVKVRKLATVIDSRCRFCLEKRKKMASQIMGELPDHRVKPFQSAFSAVCMDLFGPLIIKDDCIKKGPRTRKKVYGVIYTCLATRAVHLDIAINYDTEAVLHTLRRLLALRGDTRLIISDPGSQLVAASKELTRWRNGWSLDQLERFGAKRGLEWRFIMADSQHQNGPAESLVKMVKGVKKSMMHVIGETVLSLNEMFTLLFECSNLINERPIGLKPNSRTDSEYLSPNSLLMGRSMARIGSGPFEEHGLYDDSSKATKTRFQFVQTMTNQFWKVWIKLYLPSLLVRQKWHTQRRNLQVNDVCLLEDSNEIRGDWRLARVTEVYPDRHGVVRNVEVCVKSKPDGTPRYQSRKPNFLKRHVSKLIVIEPAEENLGNNTGGDADDKATRDEDKMDGEYETDLDIVEEIDDTSTRNLEI